MEDYTDFAPWVNCLVKYKLKFLVIPIGIISILPVSLWYGSKSFCTSFYTTIMLAVEDIQHVREALKGQ